MSEIVPSQRRLQRAPDFTGQWLDSFRAVLLRHGLPGFVIALGFLLVPEMRALLVDAVAPFRESPAAYVVAALAILGTTLAWSWYLDRRIDLAQFGWIVYLLAVSVAEEWVFRVAAPYYAAGQGIDLRAAVIVSSVVFGAIHYFTLRWRWPWCVGAALGGLALSRNFAEQGDLLLLIGVHWLATFFNTPRFPGRRRTDDDDEQ